MRRATPVLLLLLCSTVAQAQTPTLEQARTLHREARFAEAAETFHAVWQADPTLVEAHLGYQAAIHRTGGDEQLLELYQGRAQRLGTALDHYLHGRLDGARDTVTALATALKLDPELTSARACLAHVLVESGKLVRAVREAERAVADCEAQLIDAEALQQGTRAARQQLAVALLTRGWVSEAKAERGPGHRPRKAELGVARADYERAAQMAPELARAHMSLGFLLELEENVKEATTAFARAVECDPVSISAISNLARLRHQTFLAAAVGAKEEKEKDNGKEAEQGRLEQARKESPVSPAVELLDSALERMPDEAELHYAKGLVLGDLPGTRKRAVASLLRAIELDSGDADYHLTLSRAHAELGQLEQALEAARVAAKLDRKNPEVFRALARVHVRQERWVLAAGAYGRAIQLAPGDPDLPFWQAECYEQAKDVKRAIAAYERAASVASEDPAPHLRLAILHDDKTARKRAVAAYRRYLELGGKAAWVKGRLIELGEK